MMKRRNAVLALAAALTLVLALWPAAPHASAFVPCEECEEWMSPYARCAGLCNGIWISWCSDWLNWNCNSQLAPDGETKEDFLASLREQAPETLPARSDEPAESTEITQQLPVASD